MSDIHEHWRISVETFGDVIIAIESECLAGRELSEIDCATIRHAVSHLTAFLGDADQLTALQAENARLREYAIEATKALTGLTVGGSEFFAGQKLGFFKADIPACVKHIRWRFDNARKMGEAKGLSSVNAEAERLREALENMTRRYVDLAGSGDCGFWGPEEEDEVIAARAALKQET